MRIQSVSLCHRDELWRRDIISFVRLDWHSITEHWPLGMRRLPLEPSVPVITRHETCVRLRLGPLMCLTWGGSGSQLPCLLAPPPKISRQWIGCQEREKLVFSVIITSKLTTFLSITPHPCDLGDLTHWFTMSDLSGVISLACGCCPDLGWVVHG